MKPLGLYLHIPFCVRKCAYCDFVSYPGRQDDIPRYLDALAQEFDWYRERGLFDVYAVQTVFVGGGTPSLAAEPLAAFFERFQETLLMNAVEVTVETNPGTIGLPGLQRLFQAGCRRLSIGVQSFHDRELRTLGRIHSAHDAEMCIEAARAAGFLNLSLDLMFGIPGSTLANWEQTVQRALDFAPEHISAYNLTIEDETPFGRQQQDGTLRLPDEETQLAMYDAVIAMLTAAGYEQYEISNFARPGYRSQHNPIYWRNEEYLGLGAAAYSYLGGYRYWNEVLLDVYMHKCGELDSSRVTGAIHLELPYPSTVVGQETLNVEAMMGETVMMCLRLCEGLNLAWFQQRFGQAFTRVYAPQIARLTSDRLIELTPTHVRLTYRGLRLANDVLQHFLTLP
ncbi:coproporphyrinogen III oxidase, anaerobic [Candidatus Moduliflexus flocculans]|uniref:Heme chaperone HemW n=1 Tax=Candidatus Moduliflexus flocculans TaxID=1499966 RepID=A0A081BP41_9BACT|nr:coproporphyrinogen III oxidase, anaerobic [Candidatus Moduliflexus flocculans]